MAEPDSPTNNLSSVDEEHQLSSDQNHQEQHESTTNNDWPWPTDDHQQQSAIDSSGLMHLIATGGSTDVTDNNNDETLVNMPTEEHTNEQITQNNESDEHQQLPIVSSSSLTLPMDVDHEQQAQEQEHEKHAGELPQEDEEQQQFQQQQLEQLQQQQLEQLQQQQLQQQQLQQLQQQQLEQLQQQQLEQLEQHDQETEQEQAQDQVQEQEHEKVQQTQKNPNDIAEIHREMLNLIPIPQSWSHIRHQSGLFSYPELPHFNVIRQATFRDGRFVCPFCTVDFASKEGIRYHLYNSCTKSPYPKAFFRCLMCGSELADRSSLRTHLSRHNSEANGNVSTDKLDVSQKGNAPSDTTNSKKPKKKKKVSNESTPPQMINQMLSMTTSVSPHALDTYGIPTTLANSSISLPIIKSDPNDSDPKRKRGRPPKTKCDPPTPFSSFTKNPTMNPTGMTLNPAMNSSVILNDQIIKNESNKGGDMRSPRAVDISSELAELARSRMREHIEFSTDSLLPEQETEMNNRLRTDGFIQCHRCHNKLQFPSLKKLKEHLKTDCPLGPVMAICKFCRIPFSSVSSVCDHLELYHDDSHDACPEDPCRVNDRAFRAAFTRYKFPNNSRVCFSASPTTIGQLIPENESAACLSNGASCLRVRMFSCDRFLNPLDSFAASHVIVLNVGRPIRCVEWLPRSVDVVGSQFVALALEQWSYDNASYSSTNPDRRLPPGSTLLLILNCGRLRQSLHVPNLHVTVAADFGQVTCLKWLPERPNVSDPYLSYIAAGTSQGIVIIFGVPHGASRNLCTISTGAQLVPPLNRRKDGSIGCAEYGSCTALDWCHENPNKICAGYENGIVLMWELQSKSLVEQTTTCSLIYPVRRFFLEDAPVQDVKFLRNFEHLIAISLKNKQSWTVWTTRDENIFCYRHWSNSSEFSTSILHDTLYAGCTHSNNQNELLSVPTHSILIPGQHSSNHLQTSMFSVWQIVSLDYSEWIDSAAYADLDGTIWLARGDSSTWSQSNPKYRPSACVAKLSTYLTNTGGATTGQYCVQISIERTEYASGNVDHQHDETHKVHIHRKIRFNPNPGTHGWIASADKVGLFLLFRLSTIDSPLSEKLTQRLQRLQVL